MRPSVGDGLPVHWLPIALPSRCPCNEVAGLPISFTGLRTNCKGKIYDRIEHVRLVPRAGRAGTRVLYSFH